jgi:hypothetical protein
LAKDAEKRLQVISGKIFEQIKSNDVTGKSAIADMKAKGDTSNHPRSKAIREHLQNIEYAELQTVLNNNDHVVGVWLQDPVMLYNLDDKQQAAIREGPLNKQNPDTYAIKQSRDHYIKAYEALLTNTQNLSQIMASKDDVDHVNAMRVDI